MSLQPVSPAVTVTTTPVEPVSPVPTLNGSVSPNGSTSLSPSRLPRARRWSKQKRIVLGVIAFLLLASTAVGGVFLLGWLGRSDVYNGPVHTVKYEYLELTIVERGTLESSVNKDILCHVRSGTKGGSASTIKDIVEDGTYVKKDDWLISLDSSALEDQLRDQNIKVDRAHAEMLTAVANRKIALIYRESEIAKAVSAIKLAELEYFTFFGAPIVPAPVAASFLAKVVQPLDLAPYSATAYVIEKQNPLSMLFGVYQQTLEEIGGRLATSKSEREMWLDRSAWSQNMVKKRQLSKVQAEADRSRLESAEINFKKVGTELHILESFIKNQKQTELGAKLAEAILNLMKVTIEVESKLESATVDLEAKRRIYEQELEKRDDPEDGIRAQIKKCTIHAPHDGLVVIVQPEPSRFGSSSTRQNRVEPGESVFEGQKLMRIPDLSKMQVVVKVHEALITRVKADEYEQPHFLEPVRPAMLLTPDVISRPVGQLAFAQVYEKLRAQYKRFKKDKHGMELRGQKARIRVDAHPHLLLTGHVKTKAIMPSAQDYSSADVKVYATTVPIDQSVKDLDLRPGMNAEVTILADETKRKVLSLPLQAVLGNLMMGVHRKCFVLDEYNRPHMRDIEIGMSNELMVEVTKGLQEGDRVVLNARPLLDANSNLKPGVPGVKRGSEGEEGPERKKGKGKGKKGPPANQQGMMMPLERILDFESLEPRSTPVAVRDWHELAQIGTVCPPREPSTNGVNG